MDYGGNCSFFSVAESTAAMASVLFNALGALSGGDMWEAAENCHEMFDRGGFYYNKVVNDLGPLKPNQHCTLPHFPNKVSDLQFVTKCFSMHLNLNLTIQFNFNLNFLKHQFTITV